MRERTSLFLPRRTAAGIPGIPGTLGTPHLTQVRTARKNQNKRPSVQDCRVRPAAPWHAVASSVHCAPQCPPSLAALRRVAILKHNPYRGVAGRNFPAALAPESSILFLYPPTTASEHAVDTVFVVAAPGGGCRWGAGGAGRGRCGTTLPLTQPRPGRFAVKATGRSAWSSQVNPRSKTPTRHVYILQPASAPPRRFDRTPALMGPLVHLLDIWT